MNVCNRRVTVELLPTSEFGKFVKIEVQFKAEMHRWDGPSCPRGFYLSAHKEEHRNGWVSCVLGEGVTDLIEPAARYSEKRLVQLAKSARGLPSYQEVIGWMRQRLGVVFAEVMAEAV